MLVRTWLAGAVGGVLVAQVPDPAGVPDGLTGLVGQLGVTGIVVAFCWWRLRQQDAELARKDQALEAVNKTLIDMVVPALRDTAHSQNEVRAALASMLEQSRRGEYDLARRFDEWAARRDRDR